MSARWVEITDVENATVWRFDAEFLTSKWSCIWGAGCQGILDRVSPELMQGCCSVGAECFDEGDALDVAASAACIPDGLWQHPTGQPLMQQADGRWHTKLVDGACVFFNRPGFSGGSGCALHIGAASLGERPLDWKPDVCWEVPLHVSVEDDVNVVRAWNKADWGDEQPAWWCTASDSGAYVGTKPVFESMGDELAEMCGEQVYTDLVERLRAGAGRSVTVSPKKLRKLATTSDKTAASE